MYLLVVSCDMITFPRMRNRSAAFLREVFTLALTLFSIITSG